MIILGAKGHAKDVLVVLNETQKNTSELTFFDDYTKPKNPFFLEKYPIIHDLNAIDFSKKPHFASAIGTPNLRKQIVEKFIELGGVYQSVISKHAIIGAINVNIGPGCNIMPNVFISNSVKIGKGCLINTAANIHHDVSIGEYCDVSPGAKILGRVKIGNNCSIGSGAIILPDIVLGNNVTVGAGAVVIENCLSENTIIGVPGKIKNKK